MPGAFEFDDDKPTAIVLFPLSQHLPSHIPFKVSVSCSVAEYFHFCPKRVRRQIRPALPLNEISAIMEFHELLWVFQGFERFIREIGPNVKDPFCSIAENDMQRHVRLRDNISYVVHHHSNPFIVKIFWPLTARFQSAISASLRISIHA
jgi:hypothetical protein